MNEPLSRAERIQAESQRGERSAMEPVGGRYRHAPRESGVAASRASRRR